MSSRLTVYKASAGSGKTFTLAVQYIKLLVSSEANNSFRHILAVTFTNKATAEMKERILQQLYGLWKQLPSSTGYLEALKKELAKEGLTPDDSEISRRAGHALKAILHDYNRFQVETIDSFFQKVLQNLAHELSLTANLQVDLNDREVLGMAVDRIMERLHAEPRTLEWITEYVEDRLNDNDKWDVSGELKSFATEIFKQPYLLHSELLSERLGDNAFMAQFKQTLKTLQDNALEFISSAAANFRDQLEERGLAFTDFSRGSILETYITGLADGDMSKEFKGTLQKYVDDPMNMLVKAKQTSAEWRQTAEEFSGMLAEVHRFQLEYTRQYNSAALTRKNLNPLRLLGDIDEEVTALNNETDRFLLAKTPILLNELVTDTDAPFIFEKMGADFRHVMIDEFQDTSVLQWNNFKKLLVENMSTGHSNLLVGDVKQSIYRWRDGDWRLLGNIGEEMKAYRPDILPLTKNFRSEGHIISFNNALFRQAAELLDDLAPQADIKIADAYQDVEQECPADRKDSGYVRLRFYKNSTRNGDDWEETMLADLCDQVKSLHAAGLPYKEMTILLRKRSYAAPIISAFSRHLPDVQLISDEAFLLSSSLAVNIIIAALRYLSDPQDVVARAYLVLRYRQDVCQTTEGLNDLLLRNASDVLPEAFCNQTDRLKRMPLYELQEQLYHIFSLDRLDKQDAYLLTYFDKVTEYVQTNPSDLKSFLAYWDETLCSQAIPSGEMDGIRLLTIHKSKGLQFHTVLLPYFHWDIESERAGGPGQHNLLWCMPKETPYNALPVIPVSLEKRMRDSIFGEEYEEEHLQMRIDALNMMYVAFTRAEKNLYMWGKTKFQLTDNSMLSDLIQATLPLPLEEAELTIEEVELSKNNKKEVITGLDYGIPVTETDHKDGNRQTSNRMMLPLTPTDISMESYESPMEFRQSNRSEQFIRQAGNEEDTQEGYGQAQEYVQTGRLLHYIFSTIRTAADVDRTLLQVEAEGLIGEEKQLRHLRRLVENGLQRPQVADWFSGKYQLYNECSILSADPESGECRVRRPDRVMMSANDIIVVDFKFGTPHEEYLLQVREYMELLASMYPEARVKGYLWYVYSNKIEEVKQR